MINYLLNSTLCSVLLLAAFHVLLKNKALYNFNRVYLLTSVVFSLLVPLIIIHGNIEQLPFQMHVQTEIINEGNLIVQEPVKQGLSPVNPVEYLTYICAGTYSVVTLLLLIRLIKNLFTIRLTIRGHQIISYKGAQLVLIEQNLTPHTFLDYIFLNKDAYAQQRINNAVLHHELAHAQQCHSADIILIEVIQAFFWFNPFFILYRRAMQMNHEFIADAAALSTCNNLSEYQTLLISNASHLKSLPITSQFNYSITKKRLIMMTKITSPSTAWFTRLAFLPILAVAFMLFCNKNAVGQPTVMQKPEVAKPGKYKKVPSEQFAATSDTFTNRDYPSTKNGLSAVLMAEYVAYEKKYATRRLDFSKVITQPEQKRMEQLFQQMSKEQQKNRAISFMYPPKPLTGSSISRKELDSWKDPAVYGVWIDGKRIKNTELQYLKPSEFNEVFFSRLTEKAVKHDHFHYQVELMTPNYYEKYREDAIANRNNSMIIFHLKY